MHHSECAQSVTILNAAHLRGLMDRCIHCGLCLPACPTYDVFRTEMAGPRGRIDLMRAAVDGRAALGGPVEAHLGACLVCRACESTCPSGVQYGELVESVRQTLARNRPPGLAGLVLRDLLLRRLLPFPRRLRLVRGLLSLYQRSGLSRVGAKLLPPSLGALHALLPPLQGKRTRQPVVVQATAPRRGTVAFFHGCIQDAFLGAINGATVRVLQRNGFDVHTPVGQTCCSALALHLGETDVARKLARQNIGAIDPDRYDAIVNNAGGCGAVLKDYGRLLADDADWAVRASRFAKKVQDISEFLANCGLSAPLGEVRTRAVYIDSCHLRHVQKVVRQPRDLLKAVPGLELVELLHPEWCCGSAGTYNLLHADTARKILHTKLDEVAATGARTIVTTNTGCHLQLLAGVKAAGQDREVVHLVELLDRAHAAAAGPESVS